MSVEATRLQQRLRAAAGSQGVWLSAAEVVLLCARHGALEEVAKAAEGIVDHGDLDLQMPRVERDVRRTRLTDALAAIKTDEEDPYGK